MKKPNVLWIMTDQQHHSTVGYEGHPLLRTPNLDRLAAEGTVFERAYCTTPLCVPSRTTFCTGQYAARHGVFNNDVILDAAKRPLPELLREQEYSLALVGKNHVFTDEYLKTWDFVELYDLHGKEEKDFCTPPRPGELEIRRWRQNDIPFFEAPVYQAQPGLLQDSPTYSQTDYALKYLSQRHKEQPFFMFFSFESPHFPFVESEPYFSMFDPADMPGPMYEEPLFHDKPLRMWLQYYGLEMEKMTPDDIRRVQATYLAKIAFVDEQIGRVLQQLENSGELDNTIVIFCSDHGDFLGHHGLIGKTNALYEDLLRVPLMWRAPGLTDGNQSNALVENTDFLPTLLEVLGLSIPETVQGSSYAHLLASGDGEHRSRIVGEASLSASAQSEAELRSAIESRVELRATHGVGWFIPYLGGLTRSLMREDGTKLITNMSGEVELYDLSCDPHEQNNLASDVEQSSVIDALQEELSTITLV